MRIVSPVLFVTFSTLWVTSAAKPADVPGLANDIRTALSGFVGWVVNISLIIAILLLSSILVLRPILNILGFGRSGLVKGSSAAWLQRTFFGGVIARGSWFATLQKIGIAGIGGRLRVVAGACLAVIFGLVVVKYGTP